MIFSPGELDDYRKARGRLEMNLQEARNRGSLDVTKEQGSNTLAVTRQAGENQMSVQGLHNAGAISQILAQSKGQQELAAFEGKDKVGLAQAGYYKTHGDYLTSMAEENRALKSSRADYAKAQAEGQQITNKYAPQKIESNLRRDQLVEDIDNIKGSTVLEAAKKQKSAITTAEKDALDTESNTIDAAMKQNASDLYDQEAYATYGAPPESSLDWEKRGLNRFGSALATTQETLRRVNPMFAIPKGVKKAYNWAFGE